MPHPLLFGSTTLQDGRVRIAAHPAQAECFMRRLEGAPRFACVIASTDTAEIPEIFAALALHLHAEGHPGNPGQLALATTRWVSEDPNADLTGIPNSLPRTVPAFAAGLDFSRSKLPALKSYEKGLVKEGVGAGAAAFAAFWTAGMDDDALVMKIEEIVRGPDG